MSQQQNLSGQTGAVEQPINQGAGPQQFQPGGQQSFNQGYRGQKRYQARQGQQGQQNFQGNQQANFQGQQQGRTSSNLRGPTIHDLGLSDKDPVQAREERVQYAKEHFQPRPQQGLAQRAQGQQGQELIPGEGKRRRRQMKRQRQRAQQDQLRQQPQWQPTANKQQFQTIGELNYQGQQLDQNLAQKQEQLGQQMNQNIATMQKQEVNKQQFPNICDLNLNDPNYYQGQQMNQDIAQKQGLGQQGQIPQAMSQKPAMMQTEAQGVQQQNPVWAEGSQISQ